MEICGIDLGNSTTQLAILDPQGNATMVSNEAGQLFTPSVIYFDKEQIIVGQEAINLGFVEPSRCVRNWKRSMGTDQSLYKAEDGTEYRAKDCAEILLKNAARDFERRTGQLLSKAEIAVPANYNDKQKQETLDAAEAAKIEVIQLIHEPSAATLGNKIDQREDGSLIALFDLGGGTFDFTIGRVTGERIKILKSNGVIHLGGQDYSQLVSDWLLDRFEEEHGLRPSAEEDPVFPQTLWERVESLKIALSTRESSKTTLQCNGKVLCAEITRDKFKELAKDLNDKAMETAEQTFKEVGVSADEVTEFLPVGGASLMPCFRESIEECFGRKCSYHSEPHFAVAQGTAVAGLIECQKKGESPTSGGGKIPTTNKALDDVTSYPFGIAVQYNGKEGLYNSVILKKGMRIPSEHTQQYQLGEVGATAAFIQVSQGEDGVRFEKCTLLGEFDIEGLPSITDEPHRLEVTLRIDKNGMLTATAYCPHSGRTKDMEIKYKKGKAKKGRSA